jgi:hypothetical protein
MKRVILPAFATVLLLMLLPSSASAHYPGGRSYGGYGGGYYNGFSLNFGYTAPGPFPSARAYPYYGRSYGSPHGYSCYSRGYYPRYYAPGNYYGGYGSYGPRYYGPSRYNYGGRGYYPQPRYYQPYGGYHYYRR